MADLTPITREEKIIAGEDVKPVTREEKILAGMDIVPVTRREKFLKAFGGGGSGGDEEELKITDASYLFYKGARRDSIEACMAALKDVTSCDYMFAEWGSYAEELTSVSRFDTSKSKSFDSMFKGASYLTEIPSYDTSSGTDFTMMFHGCERLTSVPWMDMSHNTDVLNYMFAECKKITSVPKYNIGESKGFQNMFYNCSQLKSVPDMDFGKGGEKVNFSYMFGDCTSLETAPPLDVNSPTAYGLNNVFTNCKNLKNITLYNVRQSIQIGSGTSWGHLLTVDSLVHTIKELCTVTSTQKLTMGSANLEKIANLYCKIIDDTHEKKTMELCESTDEGAMTLIDYAALKGWQIL